MIKPRSQLEVSLQNDDDWQVADLHEVANVLAVRQNLGQVLGAEHVAQRRLRKKAGRSIHVFHVGDGHRGVRHAVVDDRVDGYRHRVFGQYLRPQHRASGWHLNEAHGCRS